ncbi:hypothetical protein DET50_10654 [Marinobacter pelagius]|uniref:DUF2066 domain-containing protein n=1 Tax=Marinobacter pelagius TaxID=379482 RepID=A0A366GUJ2_9GAMM|nr:hypothetical protein DET50_10654 [Marinobacter pelagius]
MSVKGQYLARVSRAAVRAAVLLMGLAFLGAPAQAVTVSGLYSVEVPVDGSSSAQLQQGYAEGLRRVLVRVSGSRDVLARDGVQSVLAEAESLLLSYQFLRGDDGGNRLQMSFGAVGVNRALASIDAPVWGANRPLTLAWIAVEERGSRRLITEGGEPDQWQSAFAQAASERGLPIALPPENLRGDRELLSEIWGQFVGRVRSSAPDTSHDVMALVRVSQSGGQWRAGWVFDGMAMEGGEESVTAPNPRALAQAVIDRWADRYAGRYAVAAGEVGDLPQVDIVVQGIQSVEDYGKVTGILEGFTPVQAVGASRVKGDQLTLRVTFSGELDQLKEYVALDPRFIPLDAGSFVPEPEPESSESLPESPETQGEADSASEAEAAPETRVESGAGAMDNAASGQTADAEPVSGDLPLDSEGAEQAFESLYQLLYYRWQPSPAIGNGVEE